MCGETKEMKRTEGTEGDGIRTRRQEEKQSAAFADFRWPTSPFPEVLKFVSGPEISS